jgi:hypothetical protein
MHEEYTPGRVSLDYPPPRCANTGAAVGVLLCAIASGAFISAAITLLVLVL